MRRSAALACVISVVAWVLSGCAGDDHPSSITVFAAASLTEAFTDIGAAFTEANPEIEVTFNFASSSDLATQIAEGAPADVFASADVVTIDRLADAVSTPQTFATNALQIIVEAGNPTGIDGVADLAAPELIIVTAAPEVPIGRYAQEVFTAAGVEITPKSLEENVKAVVSKVVLGEADAGIVYATDVLAAGDRAQGVDIPDDLNVVAEYPIAVTADAPSPDEAAEFVVFVLSPAGQSILAAYGFGRP